MMEPLRSEMPPDGYLEQVRKLASTHNVVLIFDEVSTGFRLSAGGVQPVLGVIPDMAVFAKSISNGYPMGAVVGKREIMEHAARMFVSSTYWSDTIGLRAALTTLHEVRRREVPLQLQQLGRQIKMALNKVATETSCPVKCVGIDIHPRLDFDVATSVSNQVTTLYIQEMAKRGCHGNASFYLNAAQGDAEVDHTANAAREVFSLITQALNEGTVEQYLESDRQEELFRRLVK